jgi:hypothetical protein
MCLCAAALAAGSNAAQAQSTVQISLNLRYTDPADPSEGGTWQLVAKTDNAIGIAAVNAYISNITAGNTANVIGNGGTITAATLGSITPAGNSAYNTTIGSAINVLYGQDPTVAIVANVGRGDGAGPNPAAPGEIAVDPLRNATWNGASLIMSGAFAGGGNAGNQFNRPAFVAAGGNSTDANVLSTATVGPTAAGVDANITTTVRGDSVVTLGLNTPAGSGIFAGDVNRDGSVNVTDFNTLAINFGDAGTFGWDQGDFNDDGMVNVTDFNALAINFGDPAPPAPTVGAVPEPTALGLISLGALAIMGARRRR